MNLSELRTPTLLLDEHKCRQNIRDMAQRARKAQVVFRPHMKTHQSRMIGEWMREEGVHCITVSSLRMAAFFAEAGWYDITVAFPVNLREMAEINELLTKTKLNLLIEDPEVANQLERELHQPVDIYITIDSGSGRTGVKAMDFDKLDKLVERIGELDKLQLRGFLTHAGHSYASRNVVQILKVHAETSSLLYQIKMRYASMYSNLIASEGDTPTCSMVNNFEGINEIRPGNFVFYDVMQHQIGSCSWDQIAVALATPVVARHPKRNELVVYGGAVHLSRDRIIHPEKDTSYFGALVEFTEKGWSKPLAGGYADRLSQEHGILKVSDEILNRYRPGDLIGIFPVHSCLTANLMAGYTTLEGRHIDHMNAPQWNHHPYLI